jgi:hypothetical protein
VHVFDIEPSISDLVYIKAISENRIAKLGKRLEYSRQIFKIG